MRDIKAPVGATSQSHPLLQFPFYVRLLFAFAHRGKADAEGRGAARSLTSVFVQAALCDVLMIGGLIDLLLIQWCIGDCKAWVYLNTMLYSG